MIFVRTHFLSVLLLWIHISRAHLDHWLQLHSQFFPFWLIELRSGTQTGKTMSPHSEKIAPKLSCFPLLASVVCVLYQFLICFITLKIVDRCSFLPVTKLKQTFQGSPSVFGPQRCVLHYQGGGRQEIITLITCKVPFLFWLASTSPSEASIFWTFFIPFLVLRLIAIPRFPSPQTELGFPAVEASAERQAGAGKGQGAEREMYCWVAVTFSGY